MTESPEYIAKDFHYDEFVREYDRYRFQQFRSISGGTALTGAITNDSPHDRVRIATLLLDDGADPTASLKSDNVNALHLLFSRKEHDFVAEAPLLKRLLDGGADINQKSPRFGLPLTILKESSARDSDLEPFYDVIFAHPGIDFDAIVMKTSSIGPVTLRQKLASNTAYPKPEFTRRMEQYEAEHAQEGSS